MDEYEDWGRYDDAPPPGWEKPRWRLILEDVGTWAGRALLVIILISALRSCIA